MPRIKYLTTYVEQLEQLAQMNRVDLKQATLKAGVTDATYYRSIVGARSLSLEVAEKVAHAITKLAA